MDPTSVHGQGLPTAKPEDEGFSSTRLERLKAVMQEYVDQKKLAGVITVVARRGKVVHFECLGMRDLAAHKAMPPDTIFRIGSMSKPITAAAAMLLYEEGRFQLNDPVSVFIPEFRGHKVLKDPTGTGTEVVDAAREITIHDLLTHTAGLSYGLDDTPVDQLYRQAGLWNPDAPLREMVQKLARLPLRYQPGTTWHYSAAIEVLGYLVEVWSQQPLDEFLRQRVFEPLGMKDTGFSVPQEKRDRLAKLYCIDETGQLQVGSLGVLLTREGFGELFVRWEEGERVNLLCGGMMLFSTAADYLRFAQMLLSGGELEGTRLLSRKTVELMTLDHLPAGAMLGWGPEASNPAGWGFGLGIPVRRDVAQSEITGTKGELTNCGAACTYFCIDPQEELVSLLMTQFFPTFHYPILRQLKVLTYQALVD